MFTASLHSYGTLFCVYACTDDTDMDFLGQYFDITHLSETWVSPYGIAWLNGSVGIGMIKPNMPLFRDSSCVPVNAEDDLKCACLTVIFLSAGWIARLCLNCLMMSGVLSISIRELYGLTG